MTRDPGHGSAARQDDEPKSERPFSGTPRLNSGAPQGSPSDIGTNVFRETVVPSGGFSPVRAVRGTVILSSLFALRELGYFADYRSHLEESQASQVLGVVAGGWVSMDLARAHYHACEALRLSPSQQVQVGQVAGKKATGTMLGTAVRLSRLAGATPWALLTSAPRIWARAYDGGGIRVAKVGENEALLEAHGNPLFSQLVFSRNSFRGFCIAFHGLVCEQLFIREIKVLHHQVDFRVMWK